MSPFQKYLWKFTEDKCFADFRSLRKHPIGCYRYNYEYFIQELFKQIDDPFWKEWVSKNKEEAFKQAATEVWYLADRLNRPFCPACLADGKARCWRKLA
jgi:hypothetical protein